MTPKNRWIILSPHLDDGALSCGGLAARLRTFATVEIWTIFCSASPLGPYSEVAKWLHQSSGGLTGIRLSWLRRKEDKAACRLLGVGHRHFSWKDAPYRKTPSGGFIYSACQLDTWDSADEPMIASIAQTLRKNLNPEDMVVAPLGVGSHVDHLVTRRAAELAGCASLLYYPDIPYAEMHDADMARKTERLRRLDYQLERSHVEAWIDAVKCYASQMTMLENAAGPLPDLIRRYATSRHPCLFGTDDATNPALLVFLNTSQLTT